MQVGTLVRLRVPANQADGFPCVRGNQSLLHSVGFRVYNLPMRVVKTAIPGWGRTPG